MYFKINRVVIYFAMQLVVALLYYLGGIITLFSPNLISITAIDQFVEPNFLAGWVYISFFPLLFLAVYFTKRKDMQHFVKLILTNSVLSLIIYVLYPTVIKDNAAILIEAKDPISYKLLSYITHVDVRTNCFPSLHVANSLLAIIFLFKLKSKVFSALCCVWFLAIAWSVLSTGQHYFYDVLGGILLTGISYFIIFKFYHEAKT